MTVNDAFRTTRGTSAAFLARIQAGTRTPPASC